MRIVISISLFLFSYLISYSQDSISAYEGGYEDLVSFGSVGITEITVGDSTVSVESHFIKDAWLPDKTQTIKDGFGFRQYKMWGQIRRYTYEFGEANGPFFFYDSTGKIVKSGVCVNGDIDGELFSYYPNGHIMTKETRQNSKVTKIQYYHENSKLKSIVNYDKKGNRHGKFVQYYPSGKIQMTGQFSGLDSCKYVGHKNVLIQLEEDSVKVIGGIESGEWIEFNEDGETLQSINYCGCEWYYESMDMGNGLPPAYSQMHQPAECKD